MRLVILLVSLSGSYLFLTSSTITKEPCEEVVAHEGEVRSGEHAFTLPDSTKYEGVGALPFAVQLGKYKGTMRSIVLSQTPRSDGAFDVELLHFFSDGQGNTFWTKDEAIMAPSGDQENVMEIQNNMEIVNGTGDLACANGNLKNVGTLDLATNILKVKLSGKVCADCN